MLSLPLVVSVIGFLILLNGVFACMEIALVSVSRVRLRRLQQENKPGASAAISLQKNFDDFFATVQIGVTFVATLSSVLGGASASELFGPLLAFAGISSASYTGHILALVAITLCISYVSLVIGELVPKSLARRYPASISTALAGPFRTFSKLMTPAVRILSASTWAVLKAFRIPERRKGYALTTEEFRMLASELLETSQIPMPVHDVLVRVTRLAQTRVEDVMVPRHRMVGIEVDSTDDPKMNEKILATYRKYPFTNFPVTDANLDNVFGIANVKDLLLEEGHRPVPLLRPATFTPRGATLDSLLEVMLKKNTQMSVVVDEHGTIDGIVTLEDVLEEFVGEIESGVGARRTAPPPVKVETELVVDGPISLHELKEFHSLALPQSRYYSTLAGFLLAEMGKIPLKGEYVDHGKWRFVVLEMDRNRIKTVKIIPRPATSDQEVRDMT